MNFCSRSKFRRRLKDDEDEEEEEEEEEEEKEDYEDSDNGVDDFGGHDVEDVDESQLTTSSMSKKRVLVDFKNLKKPLPEWGEIVDRRGRGQKQDSWWSKYVQRFTKNSSIAWCLVTGCDERWVLQSTHHR